jgi:SET domain-containing protein
MVLGFASVPVYCCDIIALSFFRSTFFTAFLLAPRFPMTKKSTRWHLVKASALHGKGVFAARDIPAGTQIIEYRGARISPEEADAQEPADPADPYHTFFFSISSGEIIDGGNRGNDARWFNHSCDPNCEAEENEAGTRVYIVALRDIAEGEELFYDYGLILDGRITKKLKEQYRCLCQSENCRGTMLALPKKKTGKVRATKTGATG